MMKKVQKTYTQEFKREAVRLAQTSGKSIAQVARELGISDSSIHQWRKELAEHGPEAFPGSGHQTALEEEYRRADEVLAEQIQQVYHVCRQVYGSPRIHAELQAQGISSSRKRVARLMGERGLSARRRRHRTITTRSEPGARVAPNLLEQDFSASRPDEKWTGDITAIWTYEGWLYLAVVLDLFSRRVIGWAMAATQDETLIETALRMALVGRRPTTELVFHSDRGSQYTSDAYRDLLTQAGITISMSRTGNCYDNAVTESFFGTLKGECVERSCFQRRGQARQIIFEYVECFYNRVRLVGAPMSAIRAPLA